MLMNVRRLDIDKVLLFVLEVLIPLNMTILTSTNKTKEIEKSMTVIKVSIIGLIKQLIRFIQCSYVNSSTCKVYD